MDAGAVDRRVLGQKWVGRSNKGAAPPQ